MSRKTERSELLSRVSMALEHYNDKAEEDALPAASLAASDALKMGLKDPEDVQMCCKALGIMAVQAIEEGNKIDCSNVESCAANFVMRNQVKLGNVAEVTSAIAMVTVDKCNDTECRYHDGFVTIAPTLDDIPEGAKAEYAPIPTD